MKRHAALRDLSVDHHHALVHARRLQSVAHDNASRQLAIADEFIEFWLEHANPHFREEEEALLPFFAGWGDASADPFRQMQYEHVLIRRDASALSQAGTLDASAMIALGRQLEAHVRFEESVVFPLIERTLPPGALAALPEVLAEWRQQANMAKSSELQNEFTNGL